MNAATPSSPSSPSSPSGSLTLTSRATWRLLIGAAQRSPSAVGGADDRRRTFPPPRRWWQLCVARYFADRGVGDMPGAPIRHPKRHPGGGGRLSATDSGTPKRVLLFIPGTYKVVPGLTQKKKCVPKVLPLNLQSQNNILL